MNRIRTFALAAFVADRASMDTLGTGVQLDFAAFTDPKFTVNGKKVIPAGTAISPIGGNGADGKPNPALLCGPATAGAQAYLLKTPAEEDSTADALSGYGAYCGGVVYETLLPDASGNPRKLSDAVKTALGSNFRFMTYEDRR